MVYIEIITEKFASLSVKIQNKDKYMYYIYINLF